MLATLHDSPAQFGPHTHLPSPPSHTLFTTVRQSALVAHAQAMPVLHACCVIGVANAFGEFVQLSGKAGKPRKFTHWAALDW